MRRGGVPTPMKPPIMRRAPSGIRATASDNLMVFPILTSLTVTTTPSARSTPADLSDAIGAHWPYAESTNEHVQIPHRQRRCRDRPKGTPHKPCGWILPRMQIEGLSASAPAGPSQHGLETQRSPQ